jgi:predicted kinase
VSPRQSGAATRAQTRLLAERVPEVVEGLLGAVPRPAKPHGSPAIAVLMGFPGVGKTHCARLLTQRLGAAHVASDQLRSQLFVAPSYADPENTAVFRILEALVERLIDDRYRVIVDATHLSRRSRASTLALAGLRGVPCAHVLVTSDESEALARLAERRRARAEYDRSDADERVYLAMRDQGFEEPAEYLTIRNGPDLASEIDRVSRALEAQWSGT